VETAWQALTLPTVVHRLVALSEQTRSLLLYRQQASDRVIQPLGRPARYLGTQARPSAIGLHAPLQQSASAVQVAPLGLQATSCQSGVDLAAPPCSGKKAVTVLCGDCSASSCSHAAAGKAATDRKCQEDRRNCAHPHDHTGFVEQYTIAMPRRSVKKRWGCPSDGPQC